MREVLIGVVWPMNCFATYTVCHRIAAMLHDRSGVTMVRDGNTVQFQQSSDTFVRDLTWAVGDNQLSVANQRAGSATFTITLTRQ